MFHVMKHIKRWAFICAVGIYWISAISAQTGPSNLVVGAGYALPAPVNVAPGQVLTFFVQGVGNMLTSAVRAPEGANLPTSLAGISVTVRQGADRKVPLFEVRPVSTCVTNNAQSPCTAAKLTAITIQIPYDLITISEILHRPLSVLAPTLLWVTENGTAGAMIELYPFPDRVHFLTACDTILPTPANPFTETGLPCEPQVTHADGTPVTSLSPANPGEEIVAYGTGFGSNWQGVGVMPPLPATGKIVTTTMPMTSSFLLDFNFRANAGPTKPFTLTDSYPPELNPVFVGLTTGYIGLYQVNFIVPQPPAGLQPCLPDVPGTNIHRSNLTVSIGNFSFDSSYAGVAICVAVSP